MPASKRIKKYGLVFPPDTSDLTIELYCYRVKRTKAQGGLGAEEHLWNCIHILWGPHAPKHFVRTAWGEQMVQAYIEHDSLAVAGCASSMKTEHFAVLGIIDWLADPEGTMVLYTSTSLKDAKKRIWGAVREYWQRSSLGDEMPGDLVDSLGIIRGPDGERSGLALVAGAESKAKESVGKLIGFKNRRVVMMADELPELSHAILEAVVNLSSNNYFKVVGLGNPASYYDPFGVMCTPEDGWESVTPEDDGWIAKGLADKPTYVLRLDGHRSENYIKRQKVIPWMRSYEDIEALKATLGENSPQYWRMVRGFWSPTGKADAIYAEADMIRSEASRQCVWQMPPVRVAALDPSFSSGGDTSAIVWGEIGDEVGHGKTLEFKGYEKITADITDKEIPHAYQLARAFRDFCVDKGIEPEDAAYDSTGAGAAFGDILSMEWSPKVKAIKFGGSPSKRKVSKSDPTPCDERFANRVSELWFIGKQLMIEKVLAGIFPDLASEMCQRTYEVMKDKHTKMRVESKKALRARTGRSPDIADAAFVLIDMCRDRFGLGMGGSMRKRGKAATPGGAKNSAWKKLVNKYDATINSYNS